VSRLLASGGLDSKNAYRSAWIGRHFFVPSGQQHVNPTGKAPTCIAWVFRSGVLTYYLDVGVAGAAGVAGVAELEGVAALLPVVAALAFADLCLALALCFLAFALVVFGCAFASALSAEVEEAAGAVEEAAGAAGLAGVAGAVAWAKTEVANKPETRSANNLFMGIP
jgi:hypothetical protein